MDFRYPCPCGSVAYGDAAVSAEDLSRVAAWIAGEWQTAATTDGAAGTYPLYGRAYGTRSTLVSAGDALEQGSNLPEFPLSGLITSCASVIRSIVGEPGRDWGAIQVRGYGYGHDSGLDWHRDGTVFAGTATLYVHQKWEPDWGGLLTVVTPCGQSVDVEPIPNRLVIMKGEQPHRVSSWHNLLEPRLTVNLGFLTRIGCFAAGCPWSPAVSSSTISD